MEQPADSLLVFYRLWLAYGPVYKLPSAKMRTPPANHAPIGGGEF